MFWIMFGLTEATGFNALTACFWTLLFLVLWKVQRKCNPQLGSLSIVCWICYAVSLPLPLAWWSLCVYLPARYLKKHYIAFGGPYLVQNTVAAYKEHLSPL